MEIAESKSTHPHFMATFILETKNKCRLEYTLLSY